MRSLAALPFLALAVWPSFAFAAEDSWDGGYDAQAERRSGFVASANLGFGMGAANGYPNEISKIDDPDFESSTGSGFASMNSLWIGGALRDWFTFGLGIAGLGMKAGDLEATASGFIFHVEAFPLYSLGGKLRDLALYADFGAGGIVIEGGPETVDGNFVSFLGAGASFELFRWGHFALGPTLGGIYAYSDPARAGGVFAGIRGSFYGGP